METTLAVLIRWLHITSVVVLIGGMFYARVAGAGYLERFRTWIYVTVPVLIGSGLYNLLTKGDLPVRYHMVFGVKMLLVLHIFAVALLMTTRAAEDRRPKLMTGVIASGLIVLLLSSYLRWISM